MIRERPEGTGMLALDKICIDGGTQMRADLNEDVVADYAQTIRDGGGFPPVVVFLDGSKHWLADGFHRHFAYQRAGALEIPADIRKGSKRDAILYSVGANASHGLRRTNADKRKAVETLLKDKEWAAWSDREIARACAVDHKTVGRLRDEYLGNSPDSRTVERNGTTYQQNTANIGASQPAAIPSQEAASEPEAERATAPPAEPAPDRADALAAARAQQAENDRWREANRSALPAHIRQAEAVREAAQAARREAATEPADGDGLTDEQRIAELREAVAVLETENATLKAEAEKFEAMRVQWEQGGFEKVIAGRDETIRVLRSSIEVESADKATLAGQVKYWKGWAKANGWKPDVVKIDTRTGALKDA